MQGSVMGNPEKEQAHGLRFEGRVWFENDLQPEMSNAVEYVNDAVKG